MKIFKMIPSWIISAIIAVLITSGGVSAYTAVTASGEVTIDEPISIIEGNTFSFNLYPGDFDTLDLSVKNSSPNVMTVFPTAVITPSAGQDICIEMPPSLTINPGQTVNLTADVFATVAAPPGTYSIEIMMER